MNCVRSTWSSPVSCQESDVFNRLASAILLFPPKVGLIIHISNDLNLTGIHLQRFNHLYRSFVWELNPLRCFPPTIIQIQLQPQHPEVGWSAVVAALASASSNCPSLWPRAIGRLLPRIFRPLFSPPGFSLLRSSVRSRLKGLGILDTLFKPGFSCWSSTSCWSLLLSVSAASSVLQLCS